MSTSKPFEQLKAPQTTRLDFSSNNQLQNFSGSLIKHVMEKEMFIDQKLNEV